MIRLEEKKWTCYIVISSIGKLLSYFKNYIGKFAHKIKKNDLIALNMDWLFNDLHINFPKFKALKSQF